MSITSPMMDSDDDMPSIIDFGVNVDDVSMPELLPEAAYKGRIVNAMKMQGKESGKKYIRLNVVIPPESFPADFADAETYPDGISLQYNLLPGEFVLPSGALHKKNICRVRDFAKALGVHIDTKLDLEAFNDVECLVHVAHRVFEEAPQMECRRITGLSL